VARLDDALAPAGELGVLGDQPAGVVDPHPAGADADLHALPDQPPGHRVGVGVELDGTVGLHLADELADLPERRPPGERPERRRLVAREADERRLAGVPCTRTSATSRVHQARCASRASQLSKPCPAMALRLTYPTPRSSLPLVRAR
jgi:hypothetical protein